MYHIGLLPLTARNGEIVLTEYVSDSFDELVLKMKKVWEDNAEEFWGTQKYRKYDNCGKEIAYGFIVNGKLFGKEWKVKGDWQQHRFSFLIQICTK